MKNQPIKDDSKLIGACVNGNPAAWSAFTKKYSGLIYVSVENHLKKYGLRPSRQDIEDIKQNVLTSIWKDRKLESVNNRRDISYWLAIVSGNAAMEHMRKIRTLEPAKLTYVFDGTDEKELAELIPSAGPSPFDETSRKEILKKIEIAIRSLSGKEKMIIKLNILYGKKYGEIAEMLHLPAGTVSNYVKRAKDKLRELLKEFQ